ncbi:MAG TPA: hypothetical protein VFZ55_04630 [Nitrososphaera sp.]
MRKLLYKIKMTGYGRHLSTAQKREDTSEGKSANQKVVEVFIQSIIS